jgi:hypothetical protein
MKSSKKNEDALQEDLQKRFQHLGKSSSRTLLWMWGFKLTTTAEEKVRLDQNKK